jgi:hypothetical protein
MSISNDIEKLEKQYISEKEKEEKKLKKLLDKKFLRKITSLKNKCFQCNLNDSFGYVLNKKTNTVKRVWDKNAHGCNKWNEKKNWIYVSVESYKSRQVSTDCGWGDYDEYAMFHVKEYFRVCPNCGLMYKIAEDILGESSRWCRCSDDADIQMVKAFIPVGFDNENGIVKFEKPPRGLIRK